MVRQEQYSVVCIQWPAQKKIGFTSGAIAFSQLGIQNYLSMCGGDNILWEDGEVT